MNQPGDIAANYHHRTKHHFHRYARSLGFLDWATQPDPFRRFADAPIIELPFREKGSDAPYDDLYTPGAIPPEPMILPSVASLFELSLGLSAWKSYQGSKWALRINPSSGNLHPTEGYFIAGPIPGLSETAGVYHYAPAEHAFECRANIPAHSWISLHPSLSQTVMVGCTSIHWREAWKYGERAYRYCQEDAGHALAAISLSAALLGWHSLLLNNVHDSSISALLGLNRQEDFADAESERPDFLLAIGPDPTTLHALQDHSSWGEAFAEFVSSADWHGRANQLSSDHVQWEIIDEVAAACIKSDSAPLFAHDRSKSVDSATRMTPSRRLDVGAASIVRRRRSAVAFDGVSTLASEVFFAMLGRIMPDCSPPLTALGNPACVHLGIFVHRISGLEPGLYCLPRTRDGETALRQAMTPHFSWKKPEAVPVTLSLFQLLRTDVSRLAAQVSCGQDIAGDSAFSLGFIAEFAGPLRQFGDWFYRRLHWEAGAIAQVLYLEAEAAGLRATGIGCFFDDAVHEAFGLGDMTFQSLYHFTLGGPVEDSRLTTLPPYPEELRNRRNL